ncbi:MAG: type II secretion system F family protein [Hyphomicrobiales bacterium]|nr:type II secretion system F family protein [Hyphomicrobiales bacterium]OQW84664.1 MAG: pilus assembly protein [Proteobacteria bacterium ST_bin15]
MVLDPLLRQVLAAMLGIISGGGLAYVLFYGRLSGEHAGAKRIEKIAAINGKRGVDARAGGDPSQRRKQIEDTLKESEERRNRSSKNVPLHIRLEQAGLSWTKRGYFIGSGVAALVAAIATFIVAQNPLIALAVGFVVGLGIPNWLVNFLKNRRLFKFIDEFPNAIDVIVRGVKAGLPLVDCIRICAQEAQEPVKSEFRKMIETQTLGIPLAEAVEGLAARVPIPETNFFSIVVTVQQRSGGNLSEILGNLSKVLRDRKKMKAKINAMSQEAKASAAIIASLPFLVLIMVYLSSPDYIQLLWTTPTGKLLMFGSVLWMLAGILVMRKMINFDF